MIVLAAATVGVLALFGGRAVLNSDRVSDRVDDEHSLALSPTFVDGINARHKSWTASIPPGLENARHSDLKRIAGGRLSAGPRSELWQTSEYASVIDDAEDDAATKTKTPAKPKTHAKGKSKWASSSSLGQSLSRYIRDRSRVGGFIEDYFGGPQPVGMKSDFDPEAWGLPTHFDARQKWPKCASLIGGGRDQGNCGSCWAMAPAEVMSDRLCIQSDGERAVELSPFQLLACATSMSQGCDGGESTAAYEYARSVGVVSGAQHGDAHTCAPYPFDACHHPCTVLPTPQCPESCENGSDMKAEKIRVKSITSCPTFDLRCVARELYHNGPVSSYAGDIYEEFYAYSDGVYRESADVETRGQNHGGHVIKVIGWGRDDDSGGYYWVIVNSWLNWGQNGVGRIAVGEIGIGAGVEAAVMDV